jgi:DNA-binding MarR family transcriptional regulator
VGEGDGALLDLARTIMGISLRAADQIGGVSVVQLRALTVLREAGPANLGQLTDGMGVTVSTTSRLVDRLVTAGFVDRRTARHTRREIELSLTDQGRAVLAEYDGHRLAALHACLEELSEDERATVLTAATALSDAARRAGRSLVATP